MQSRQCRELFLFRLHAGWRICAICCRRKLLAQHCFTAVNKWFISTLQNSEYIHTARAKLVENALCYKISRKTKGRRWNWGKIIAHIPKILDFGRGQWTSWLSWGDPSLSKAKRPQNTSRWFRTNWPVLQEVYYNKEHKWTNKFLFPL